MSDDELLEQELNYVKPARDTRFFKTHPAGYNVLTALGALLGLFGFVLGGVATTAALGREGLSPLLSGAVGLVLAIFLGGMLPPMLWRAIGPLGRAMLRPLGSLGAGPVVIVAVLGFAVAVGSVKMLAGGASFQQILSGGPLQGDDWQILSDSPKGTSQARKMPLGEARLACAALGKGWRLPGKEDIEFVNQRVTAYHWRRCRFYLESAQPEQQEYLGYNKRKHIWELFLTPGNPSAQVLCIRREARERP